MKTFTLFCCLLLAGISPFLNAQNEINLNELLAELENNHMGAITDVFTWEELVETELRTTEHMATWFDASLRRS